MAYRRRRFGTHRAGPRQPRAAIKETVMVYDKVVTDKVTGIAKPRTQLCSGCTIPIKGGDRCVRFMLSKRYRVPCTSCHNEPKRSRWYHEHCRPTDVNKAMGFDPTNLNPGVHVHRPAAPPPPMPKGSKELRIESILAFEAALRAGMRDRSIPKTETLDKQLNQLSGIKERILRGTTEAEGEAATNVALKRLIDIVFADKK